jgi:hypothetical protein
MSVKKLFNFLISAAIFMFGCLLWSDLWGVSRIIGAAWEFSAENSTPYKLSNNVAVVELVLFAGSTLTLYIALLVIQKNGPTFLPKWILGLASAISISLVALYPLFGFFALYPSAAILIAAYTFRRE